jgi:hypothetical protein
MCKYYFAVLCSCKFAASISGKAAVPHRTLTFIQTNTNNKSNPLSASWLDIKIYEA